MGNYQRERCFRLEKLELGQKAVSIQDLGQCRSYENVQILYHRKKNLSSIFYLDLEEIRLLVFTFGHVDGDELKLNIFLEETS